MDKGRLSKYTTFALQRTQMTKVEVFQLITIWATIKMNPYSDTSPVGM